MTVSPLRPGMINATWSTFGFDKKIMSFLGNMLIALQECKNPWSSGYAKRMAEKMPLLNKVKPDRITDLLVKAGFREVRSVEMQKVCAAEYNAMPLRNRLAYKHERYTITGFK